MGKINDDMTFQQKLQKAIEKNNSLLSIGLDADINKLPDILSNLDSPLFDFNKAIIDATSDLVCSYKINSAFYEAEGASGIEQLQKTCSYIHDLGKDIPIILDAKRADIGNTNNGYVRFAFDYLKADAITLHPYLGHEALESFLECKEKGMIILCRTSNKGAGELQDLPVYSSTSEASAESRSENDSRQAQTIPLYIDVARKVVTSWNKNNNCLLVVGATYPQELKEIREVAPDIFFLVPGIGAQGGDLENTLKNGLTKEKSGLIIHSARGILYASNGKDFAEKAREEAEKLRDAIDTYR